ncbi:MAG: LacI family transcriptional regulator [Lachnospiraceae bacterium]|nr:LacI family transcriptional regulator [Lachnospiraceae bacterium]
MTIYDISKKAGVSIATVSRVLNGSSNVSPATRKKVNDVIEQYDYTPNAYARGMGLGSLKTVGILCADCSDLFLAKAVYYLQQELQAQGYEALLCCTGYNLDVKKNYLNLILSKKVDGIVLVGSNFIADTEAENKYIMDASAQVPIMLLNAAFDYPNVYSILCDDQGTMTEVTNKFLDADCTDIIYLYNSLSYSGRKKMKGFKAALNNRGINADKRMFFFEGKSDDVNAVADFVQEIADKGVKFNGVVCAEDTMALGAMKYAMRNDIKVPEELEIIGYNDSILCECCTPEITSVDNRLETQTHQLVATLVGVLSGEEMPARTIFSGRIVERKTTSFVE